MFLQEAIQINSLRQIFNDLLTRASFLALDLLDKMKSEITASYFSKNILHERPGSLNNKRILGQLKTNFPPGSFLLPKIIGKIVQANIYKQL